MRLKQRLGRWRLVCMTAAVLMASAAAAGADEWNDKTIVKVSEPVMVPGATLQPGTYVFKLMNLAANRHTVQIMNEDETKVIAVANAVPIKRQDPKGDVVMKFNPTAEGAPVAMKGWFYPGSLYGHEFIYSEDQAKQIAARTKTVVLSTDMPDTDMEKATIRTYDASGAAADWRRDEATMKEWEEWRTSRGATAKVASPAAATEERKEATAPMVKGDFQGMRVKLDDLEDNPKKYIGQTVSVDAEVEEIFGPRVFTIDEPNWGDLQGEILVYMPTTLAALIKDNDRVTITGTVKPFVKTEIEREWGWLELDRDLELELENKPVLVANRIVGGSNNTALVIALDETGDRPVGTTGAATAPTTGATERTAGATERTTGATGAPLTDLGKIAAGDDDLVGRRVNLTGVKVEATAKDGGFFTKTPDGALFVLPADDDKATVKAGDTVSVQGVVLQLPRHMEDRLKAPSGALNQDIYLYATTINK